MTKRNYLYTILVIGFAIRLIIAFMRWEWLQVSIYDDAFYYFAIAKTIISHGMVSADGITLTNGFHPLWLLTILPVWLVKLSDVAALRAVMLIATCLDTMTGYLIYRISRQLYSHRVGIWAAILYLFNPVVIVQSMSGMETPLVALMLVLWVWIGLNRDRVALWGIVGGLLFLARTDMALVLLAGYGYYAFADKKFPVKSAIWTLAVVAPWLLWNYNAFGTVFQASGSAYPWIFHDEWSNWSGNGYFGTEMFWKLGELVESTTVMISTYVGGIVVAIIAQFALFRETVRREMLWLLFGTGAVIFIHTFIRWFPRIWYFHTFYIALLLLTVPLFARIHIRYKAAIVTLACFGWIFAMAKIDAPTGSFIRIWKMQERAMVATEIINMAPPGSIIGAWNSGYPQYFAKDSVTVVNLDGLANNDVLPYLRQYRMMEYCEKMGIQYIVDNSNYMLWSFGKYFEGKTLERVKLVKRVDNIGGKGNDMCLFRIDYPDKKG